MIDRLLMLWQASDPASRQYALHSSTISYALITLDVMAGYGGESRVSWTCEAKLMAGYF
jgi:hypothetical protein